LISGLGRAVVRSVFFTAADRVGELVDLGRESLRAGEAKT